MGWGDLPGRPGGRVAMAVIYLAVWRDKRAKFQTEVEGGARLSLQTPRLLAKKRIVSSKSGHLGRRRRCRDTHIAAAAALWVIF